MVDQNLPYRFLRGQPLKYGQAGYPTSAGYLTYLGSPQSPCKRALTPPFFINLRHICKEHFFFVQWNKKRQTEFYEQMTSNPVFTKRNVQKANAYRFQCI